MNIEPRITPVELPAHTKKFVSWDENGQTGRAYILVGYCPDTIPYFLALCNLLLRSFPSVAPENIICGKVSKSDCVYGHTLVMTNIKGPKRKIEGWSERDVDFNY